MRNNWTAIIPAAGKSKRFEYHKSKTLYKFKKKTLIEHIVHKVRNEIKNIIIIANTDNAAEIKKIFKSNLNNNIKIIIQKKIKGMAIAIQNGLAVTKTKFFCTIWADQIGLTRTTIHKTIKLHQKNNFSVTFPICFKENPYVYITLKNNSFLNRIVQSRETLVKKKMGYTDCGFFCCDTDFIKKKIKNYIKNKKIITKRTKEYDFLLLLNLLAKKNDIKTLKTLNKKDTIGINQIKDLKKI